MDLHCYIPPHGNFGDEMNHWFWDEVLPGWREALPDHLLIGIGTLINNDLPRGRPKLVIGSGVGYGAVPDAGLMAEIRFESVRGPRSAATLGLPAAKGIMDPAMLLPDLPGFQGIARSGRPIFIPHEASMHRQDWAPLCDRAGVDYVSPGGDSREVIRRIAAAPLVIAESMHAVIIADAFGTPWHAVSISHLFNGTKWLDWADSLGVTPRIGPLYPEIARLAAWRPRRFRGSRPVQAVRPAAEGSRSVAPKGPARGHPRHLSLRIRMELEALATPAMLRRLIAQPGQLSDRAALATAQARYRAVLETVQQQFETGSPTSNHAQSTDR